MAVRPVDQQVMDLLRIILEGCAETEVVLFGQGIEQGSGKGPLRSAGLPARHNDRALINGQILVRDHQFLVKLHLVTQARAFRAGSEGIVEGK